MRHVIKKNYRIIFSDSYKNIYDKSMIKESVLGRSDAIRNSVKLARNKLSPLRTLKTCILYNI